MDDFKVAPLTYRPTEERVRMQRNSYPFDSMAVGTQFVVKDQDQWKKVRAAASAYSLKHSIRLRCTQTADGLVVWRDTDDGSIVPVTETNPTRFEYVAYLLTLSAGQSFTLGPDYANRYEQVKQWTVEHMDATGQQFDAEVTTEGLLIKAL